MGLTQSRPQGGSPGVPAVIFANWREVLNRSRLAEPTRAAYSLAIAGYLDYCRRNGQSVTSQSARDFMADVERRQLARNPGLWKNGLNWFFAEGRRSSAWTPGGEPPPGRADTGATPWERRLIERLRLNHYSWRTEQTGLARARGRGDHANLHAREPTARAGGPQPLGREGTGVSLGTGPNGWAQIV